MCFSYDFSKYIYLSELSSVCFYDVIQCDFNGSETYRETDDSAINGDLKYINLYYNVTNDIDQKMKQCNQTDSDTIGNIT